MFTWVKDGIQSNLDVADATIPCDKCRKVCKIVIVANWVFFLVGMPIIALAILYYRHDLIGCILAVTLPFMINRLFCQLAWESTYYFRGKCDSPVHSWDIKEYRNSKP